MSFMNREYNLTEREASKKLSIDPRTLKHYREAGVSPAFLELPSGHARYSLQDLIDWQENQRKGEYGRRQSMTNGGLVTRHKGGIIDADATSAKELATANETARTFLDPKQRKSIADTSIST